MEDNKFTRMSTQDNFITEKVDIIKNNLLGDYDNSGNYIISSQIMNELLNLKKHRKSSYGNSMFCVGNLLGYGEIAFELSFDKKTDENTNAKAYLYVLEDVDKVNGYLQNTIKTKIAEFSSSVENFIEESYQKFNITDESDDDDEEGKEKKDLSDFQLEDSYILAKKAYMLLLDKLEDEKLLDAYGKFFTAKLTALSEMDNEFAKAVIEKFNSQYTQIENLFLKEKNYKALNDLLDASIEQVSCTQDIFIAQENEYLQTISGALTDFTQSVNSLSNSSEQTAIQMLGNADRSKVEEMYDSTIVSQNENDDIGNNDGGEFLPPEDIVERDEEIVVAENILDNPILYEESDEMEETTESEELNTAESLAIDEILQSVYEQNIQQEEVQPIEESLVDESQVINEVPNELSEQITSETPVQADVQESTQSEENAEEITILRDEDIFETDDEILANSIQKEALIQEELNAEQSQEIVNIQRAESVQMQEPVIQENTVYENIAPVEEEQQPIVPQPQTQTVVPPQQETLVPSQQVSVVPPQTQTIVSEKPIVAEQDRVEENNQTSSGLTEYIQRKQEVQRNQSINEQTSTQSNSLTSRFDALKRLSESKINDASDSNVATDLTNPLDTSFPTQKPRGEGSIDAVNNLPTFNTLMTEFSDNNQYSDTSTSTQVPPVVEGETLYVDKQVEKQPEPGQTTYLEEIVENSQSQQYVLQPQIQTVVPPQQKIPVEEGEKSFDNGSRILEEEMFK